MLPPFDRCNAAYVVKYPLDGQLVCLSAVQGRRPPMVGEERMRLSAPSLSQAGTEYPDAAANPGAVRRPPRHVGLVPILLQKSFWGDERNFPGPLMRFTRGDVSDHIVSSKIDHDLRSGVEKQRSSRKVQRSTFARF
jgi:hypothetical protein